MGDDKYGGSAKASRRRERKKASKSVGRRKKEFTYRGFTIEELKAMTPDELMPLMPARARRSMRRGMGDDARKFWEAIRKGKQNVETHCREILVLPELVGHKVGIHKGNEFKVIEVLPEMVGHYLGEFALTRKFNKHAGPGVGATRSSKFMPLK
jgi:small subunit ribosomal protein S19